MQKNAAFLLALLFALLASCTSAPTIDATKAPASNSSNTAAAIESEKVVPKPAAPAAEANIVPLSPYSTEGLLTLNQFRSNNVALNDFLIRNRKPDYFFSGDNSDYAYQKIYLVYLESENLYFFNPQLADPYKRFHPLPASIKQSLGKLIPQRVISKTVNTANANTQEPQPTDLYSIDYKNDIEKSLSVKNPQPYLNSTLLYSIPQSSSGIETPIYPDLYFLDKPLSEILENQYSAKLDNKKKLLKLIFPQSYESDILYKKAGTETRKIFVERGTANKELSLVVPDFLPGSAFYQATRGNMSKAFSSLYQVNVPKTLVDSNNLHMRYSIKLCQKDEIKYCAASKNNTRLIRAIVIAATLYDRSTGTPIETFVLK